MFTGIIQEIGTVADSVRSGGNLRVTVAAVKSAPRLQPGSSIAVNGACLTAVECHRDRFVTEVVEETLRKTALEAQLTRGSVNLELPLRADGLVDGHLVLGHVDTTGTISTIEERDGSWWFSVKVPGEFLKFVVHTGSIAVDGVSLTVAELTGEICRISIIPRTMTHTIFGRYRPSDRVNIEVDVIGKYVERLLKRGEAAKPPARIPGIDALREQGF